VKGQHVLLVEALVQSGLTSEFLIRNLVGRGAASVKLAVLLDKQSARRVSLQPDYFGFLMNENFVVGYGLGERHLGRNLPYIAGRAEAGVIP
jgi:hypoxanthine phosphoribosyltransferase